MKTVYTQSVSEAAGFIRKGGVVAFPTETVFGLGADATQERSVEQIFQAKGRPSDNPLIVHLHSMDQMGAVVQSVSRNAERLMEKFFPGPLSIILPKAKTIPDRVTAGLNTVAIRIPGHSVAASFLAECAVPVAAPSANLSGMPSPTNWQAVQEDLDGRIHAVLTVGEIDHGIESTVVDCSEPVPRLLRAGSISLEQLKAICSDIQTPGMGDKGVNKSPGTKYRHYSPSAEVILVQKPNEYSPSTTQKTVYLGVEPPPDADAYARVEVYSNPEDYAKHVYEAYRDCDRHGIEQIICQTVPEKGIGTALNDRLRRSADQ